MNVNSVSFGAQDFNALIAEPPANSVMASTGMLESKPDSFKKSGSTGGKILKTAIGLGVIAGGLALLRGKVLNEIVLDGIKNQTGFMAKAKYGVAKAGQMVIDGWKYLTSFFTKKAAEATPPATPPAA